MVAAREISRDPKVLIAAQPTRGLDVGAIEYLHRRLVEERDEGRAILLVSLELDEILSLSDRILVIYEGEIVGEHGEQARRGGDRDGDARRRARGRRVSEGAGAYPEAARARHAPDHGRGSARPPAPRRRDRRPGRDRGARVRDRRPRRPRHRPQPVPRLPGHRPRARASTGSRTRGKSTPATRRPYNLSQTLLQTTTLILTGLAVAFAFRCGLFNIGGQGQYFMGLFVASWVGTSFVNMTRPAHILLGVGAAALAGAAWAAIAGFLKAAVGAHEVITTIMLNWIAYWIGSYLFQQGGPLQGPANKPLDIPISADIAHSAKLPVFWGDADLQGLHIGFFVAIAALIVFWAILNRTTLGYEVRAVGFNPDAAAYGGIKVRTNYVRAMAISGAFAGLAGGLDMLGYLFHVGTRTSRPRASGSSGSRSRY